MGDRSGLTRLDRTNGFDDGRDYMKVKKSKLAQQSDQLRDALRNRNNSSKTDIFKGVSINVNGRTQPTADELKRLILLNGGDYHPYYRYQTTKFMIATNLSLARMKRLRPDDRVVRPEWITESVEAKCLLPYEDYQIFVDVPRGKTGSVLDIESDNIMLTFGQSTSTDLVPVAESYSRSFKKNKQKPDHPATKSRDIREMFAKSVRNLDNGDGKSDHAQETLGDVVYVQAPEIGSKYAQFDEVGAIESVKAASEIVTPVSGEIVSVNKKLEEKPALVNSDCYGDGWLFEIKLGNIKELEELMDEDEYKKYLKNL